MKEPTIVILSQKDKIRHYYEQESESDILYRLRSDSDTVSADCEEGKGVGESARGILSWTCDILMP